MDHKTSGDFSANLLSLQLQMKTLLEGFGGEQAIKFLDVLSTLSKSEQGQLLNSFTKVTERVAAGAERFDSKEDIAMHDFEERLFNDVLSSIQDEIKCQERKFEVVSGGKGREESRGPIDLAKARLARKAASKSVLN